ncbi:response regulator [Shewanella sairae]|uniref:Response regulator n=1 Tax=Shewanella sairae TaxID=190310 RepID=A0ABQ4PNB5_9GAMM|nr:response regulator [Shewanella sairae]MCL1131423.1 response regulator [Shewanella sairae]GIU49914.1 response regulator [Shewanella sairae]
MALSKLTILLVEDDPVFRKLVASFLERRGAKVFEAENGEQGLEAYKSHSFDIVIADLSMPKLGGLGMLKALRHYNPNIPVIIVSGNQGMSDVVESLRNGASDYLVKPIADLYLIENAIHESLNHTLEDALTIDERESLSYQELTQNLALLEQNSAAAKGVQQQLFPPSRVEYSNVTIDYSLFNNNEVSAHFIDTAMIGDKHIIVYMAHFQPHDNRAAFASVLLKSFVNQKISDFQSEISSSIIEPFNMLVYLNDRMSHSGLEILVDMTYIVLELNHYRAAIAQSGSEFRCYLKSGESHQLSPLALPESLQLGISSWCKPSVQFRTLLLGEKLCIATHTEEHKQQLIANQFHGLIHNQTITPGGFIQLSIH